MSTAVEEYLRDPAYEHFEYADGQAIEIHLGTLTHSRIQNRLGRYLDVYFEANPIGFAGTEMRCRIRAGGLERFRLPDLAAVLSSPLPNSPFLDGSPDLVIEIKSPEDSVVGLFRKMNEYLTAGTRLGWLVIPEEESVFVFTPGQTTRTATPGEALDGADVLPGLNIQVNSIFPS